MSNSDLARLIRDEIMRNGSGQTAFRLVLVDEDERDLGGWARKPIREAIERILNEHLTPAPAGQPPEEAGNP